jgi:DNA-binding protein H-NS
MSDELLNKIFEKLASIEAEAQSFRGEVKKEFEAVNKKLGSIQEQVVKNSEAITIMINGQSKGEHQF